MKYELVKRKYFIIEFILNLLLNFLFLHLYFFDNFRTYFFFIFIYFNYTRINDKHI